MFIVFPWDRDNIEVYLTSGSSKLHKHIREDNLKLNSEDETFQSRAFSSSAPLFLCWCDKQQ